ncbi:MAG: hypothetical protein WKF96_23820 [Solirubrobacteraceae bacterium]
MPDAGTPLLFGDIFSPDWLFDAVVNDDAVRLGEVSMRGGLRGYAPLKSDGPKTDKDFILAHGEPCRAVLLADDCEIETCLVRKGGRGRLLFAALTPWPSDEDKATKARTMTTFRRHPLEPGEHFDGGIVDLRRLFAVNGQALTSLGSGDRIVALANAARAGLEQRWAAFATRRGPLAAVDNATKLAHLLDAGDDVARFELLVAGEAAPSGAPAETARSVARAFTQAWKAEGEVMQCIADAHEAKNAGHGEVAQLEDALRTLADLASTAADALESHRAA